MSTLNKTKRKHKVRLPGSLRVLVSIASLITLLVGVIYLFGNKGISETLQVALIIGILYSLGGRRLEPVRLVQRSSR